MAILTIIKSNEEFQRIFEKGHSIYGKYLVVYFLHHPCRQTRFGFCVGRKLGSAVKRNRIKRLFRVAARSLKLPSLSDWDILFVARPAIAKADLNRIIDEIKHILSKASFLCKNQGETEDSQ